MSVLSRILGVVAISSAPASAQSLAEQFSDTDWPKQTQLDAAPFLAEFARIFSLASADDQGSPNPELLRCDLSDEQQWRAVGLTATGIDTVNPAAHMPEAAAGLTSKLRSIEVRSNAAGCAILQTPEYLNDVPDTEKAYFSTRHLQQPVYIRAHFETGTRQKKRPTRTENRVTIQHVPTGIQAYPWAVRSWYQQTRSGLFFMQTTSTELHFEGINRPAVYDTVALGRSYDKEGKLMPSSMIRAQWVDGGKKFSRVWSGFLIFSYRDSKRHGLNFNGVNMDDGSFLYDCYDDDRALDYYRIVNDYDCASVPASEFGQEGVFRSAELTRLAAKVEAESVVAGSDVAAPGMAGECVKAYAAARVCENMPSDPFGITRGICTSGVKKKFGGSGCKLPF